MRKRRSDRRRGLVGPEYRRDGPLWQGHLGHIDGWVRPGWSRRGQDVRDHLGQEEAVGREGFGRRTVRLGEPSDDRRGGADLKLALRLALESRKNRGDDLFAARRRRMMRDRASQRDFQHRRRFGRRRRRWSPGGEDGVADASELLWAPREPARPSDGSRRKGRCLKLLPPRPAGAVGLPRLTLGVGVGLTWGRAPTPKTGVRPAPRAKPRVVSRALLFSTPATDHSRAPLRLSIDRDTAGA